MNRNIFGAAAGALLALTVTGARAQTDPSTPPYHYTGQIYCIGGNALAGADVTITPDTGSGVPAFEMTYEAGSDPKVPLHLPPDITARQREIIGGKVNRIVNDFLDKAADRCAGTPFPLPDPSNHTWLRQRQAAVLAS